MKNKQAVSVTLDKETINKTKEIANSEKRSLSQMLGILIEIGIKQFKNQLK